MIFPALGLSHNRVTKAFSAGLTLAAVTSGALLTERLAHGGALFPPTLLVMFGALLCWLTATSAKLIIPQVTGAVLGIGLTHLFFARNDQLLVESSPQFVNDLVFIAAILCAVWSLRLEGATSIGAIALALILGLYRATSSAWHVDAFPGSAVQDLVLRQSLAVALGLLFFDLLYSQRETPT